MSRGAEDDSAVRVRDPAIHFGRAVRSVERDREPRQRPLTHRKSRWTTTGAVLASRTTSTLAPGPDTLTRAVSANPAACQYVEGASDAVRRG